ncbi:MAG: hemerythrin domain-containing protein [bacterium]
MSGASWQEHPADLPGEPDIFETLEDAYERLETLLERVFAPGEAELTPDRVVHRRRRRLRAATRSLASHLEAEECLLYGRLDGGEPAVAAALAQHHHLRRLIAELSALSPANPAWERRARSLKWSAEAHFQHEEQEIFDLLRSTLGAETQRRLAVSLRNATPAGSGESNEAPGAERT